MNSERTDGIFFGACGAAVVGAVMAAAAVRSYASLPSLDDPSGVADDQGEPRSVSIVIPARDEERNLAVLLPSFVGQGATDVIVVDDGSTDNTAALAVSHGATVISAGELPPGWAGKSHACALGAASAASEWLLFLDADTSLASGAVRRAGALAASLQVAALSVFPRQTVQSAWEKLLIPVAYQAFFAGVTFDPVSPLLNGQFVLIRRALYEATGGHGAASVRGSVIEDVELGRLIDQAGGSIATARGDDQVAVRMYRGIGEVRSGFGKNVAQFLAIAPRRGLVVALATMLSTLPLPLVLIAARRDWLSRCAAAFAWLAHAAVAAYWNSLFLGATTGPAVAWGLVRPFAAIVFQAIALESFTRTFIGRDVSWKGRRYPARLGTSRGRRSRARHLPWRLFPELARDLIRRRRRSFLADCQEMRRQAPMGWENLDALPAAGPVCIVANHYQRPDLWIGWAGALIACAVAARRGDQIPRFLVLGDFHARVFGRTIPLPGARWAFQAVAYAWSMVSTTDLDNPIGHSAALRTLLRILEEDEAIVLFPEGPQGRAGVQRASLPGVGRFLGLLNRRGVPVVPVGVRDDADRLVARFGEPIVGWPVDRRSKDVDADVGALVMGRIAACAQPFQPFVQESPNP